MLKLLGIFLLLLPFVAITIYSLKGVGVYGTLLAWGIVIVIVTLVSVGVWLISI
jgi:hypothetical protein